MSSQMRMDVEIEKPPYHVPTMAETNELPPNGYKVISTFSGCGGSCLGFKMAGFDVVYASEFVPAAQETYRANHPKTPLDVRDIRDVDWENVLTSLGLQRGEVDVCEGSPPCSSFSMAGKREAGWGKVKKYSDVEQRTDDLFDEYCRMIEEVYPRVFVAENVSGLLLGAAREYLDRIVKRLERAGYVVWVRELNAVHHGVPQTRKRVIFVGVRRDLGVLPAFPEPLGYGYSMKDALPSLRTVVADQRTSTHSDYDEREFSVDEPIPTVTAAGVGSDVNYDWEVIEDEVSIEGYAIGREWERTAEGASSDVRPCSCNRVATDASGDVRLDEKTQKPIVEPDPECPECRGRGQLGYFSLVRPDADGAAPTVTQTGGVRGAASVTHPTEKRKFTIAELKRLCAFPDDFVLTGSWNQQWERLGRAVPPLMMRAVAATVRDEILKPADEERKR